jgi:hypothetical protein
MEVNATDSPIVLVDWVIDSLVIERPFLNCVVMYDYFVSGESERM